MTADPERVSRRVERLTAELADEGFGFVGSDPWRSMVLDELDYALHPMVHERRVPSYGAMVEPTIDGSEWETSTELNMTRRPISRVALHHARRFADGMSSWLIRHGSADDELVVFDRPPVRNVTSWSWRLDGRHDGAASPERQRPLRRRVRRAPIRRDPVATRIAGRAVDRHRGLRAVERRPRTLERLLEFAVHDLGSRRIGALLVYLPEGDDGANYEERLPIPPPLQIQRPADLAPLRHVLSQVDGAAVFDSTGTLRRLGVRLVPSAEAEQ